MEQQEFLHCCGSTNQYKHLGNNRILSLKFDCLPYDNGAYPRETLANVL